MLSLCCCVRNRKKIKECDPAETIPFDPIGTSIYDLHLQGKLHAANGLCSNTEVKINGAIQLLLGNSLFDKPASVNEDESQDTQSNEFKIMDVLEYEDPTNVAVYNDQCEFNRQEKARQDAIRKRNMENKTQNTQDGPGSGEKVPEPTPPKAPPKKKVLQAFAVANPGPPAAQPHREPEKEKEVQVEVENEKDKERHRTQAEQTQSQHEEHVPPERKKKSSESEGQSKKKIRLENKGSKEAHKKDVNSTSPMRSRKTQTKEDTQFSKRKLRTEKEDKTRESARGARFKNAANQVLQIIKIGSKDKESKEHPTGSKESKDHHKRAEQTQDDASKMLHERKTVTEKTQKVGRSREDPTREKSQSEKKIPDIETS